VSGLSDDSSLPPASASGTSGSDYFLKDLDNCVVIIMDTLSALKIENIRNCQVLTGGRQCRGGAALRAEWIDSLSLLLVALGPIAGSTFARGCVDCVISLIARQLRIHDSHVRARESPRSCRRVSRAISRMCNGSCALRVAPSSRIATACSLGRIS
jgi:hypothetical protein